MSKWSDIYKNQMSRYESLGAFIDSKVAYKKILIDIIKKYSIRTKKILEVGCGSGVTSIFLEQAGYKVIGVDSDPDMVTLAKSIATQQKSSVLFKVDDIRTLETMEEKYFDVVFSNGVTEHFYDIEIIAIINRHLVIGDYVTVSIPSNYFTDDQKIYGNERFMSADKWRSILSATKGYIVEEFTFNSDKTKVNRPQFLGFVLSSL